ncbi:MAG: (d)CMP kinase [Deltaproteobacteria bacterium]|nr:(d)CMP kinase [Deltaproteobacteria bacterium]MBW2082118.1 (d)CMP kinase [Deltaproteobacteria bacterium]HDM09516.1 (d)CMP kinase [Desulfobacteraceae bacterium]
MVREISVIAIDGPAGAGKSTVSREVAKRLGFMYLDTGAMYRALALAVKKAGIDPQNDKSLASLCKSLNIRFDAAQASPRIFLNGEDVSEHIRTPEIDMLASKISAIAVVRQEMTRLQRAVAEKAGRAVAEGRDMGTVVFPDAKCKFFLTATLEERARRRYEERRQRGEKVDPAQVARELKKRDEQDEKRALAPLKPAEDAVIIDTTQLTIDEVVDKICGMAKPRFAQTQK